MTRCLHKFERTECAAKILPYPLATTRELRADHLLLIGRQPARQAGNQACIMSAAGNDARSPPLRRSMQRRILSGLAALAAALPLASHADVMDYSFAEVGYVDTNLDTSGDDVDGNGFALRGSLAVNPNFFVFATTRTWTSTSTSTPRCWKSAAAAAGRSATRSIWSARSASSRRKSTSDSSTTMTTASCSARACAAWWRRSSSWKAASTTATSMSATRPRSCSRADILHHNVAGGVSVSIGDDVTSLGLNVRMTF